MNKDEIREAFLRYNSKKIMLNQKNIDMMRKEIDGNDISEYKKEMRLIELDILEVENLLAFLSDTEKKLIELRYLQGVSCNDTAAIFNFTKDWIYKLEHKIFKKLANVYIKSGEHDRLCFKI